MTVHEAASRGFDREAAAYERGRPEYPGEAIAWLVKQAGLATGRVVADIGAGTGKLTRALAISGATLIAVEPVAGMREILARRVPQARVIDATAEDLPLADASVDLVVVGQAFHWFDGRRALAEFARVLKRDGRLAIVYNRRDREDPLMRELERIMVPYRRDTPSHRGEWREAFKREGSFALAGEVAVPFVELRHRAELVDRVVSVSFIAALPDAEKSAVRAEVQALAGESPVELRYISEVTLYKRS